MAISWADASEITLGLVLSKRLMLNAVRHELFAPPYDDVIAALKDDLVTEELIEKFGLMPIQAAIDAAKNVNGLGNANWPKILENAALSYDAGHKMEKIGRKLQQGEEIDWSLITQLAQRSQKGIGGDFRPLSEIEAKEIPFKLTGFKAIDEHLGGIPEVGQIIVAAPPGAGKSSFMVEIAVCYAKIHPEEFVAIFTLEMMAEELKMRINEIARSDDTVQKRIMVNDAILTPEEVINKAASIEHLGLVCIDFADLLIRGETTESSMAHIYRTFMLGSKSLGCPVMLLSQLSRAYTGGVPHPSAIRWTGLAEALGWMILMLYNPGIDFFADEECEDEGLEVVDGMGYIIAWKIRGGFRKHLDESPGAIQLPFKPEKGWHYNHPGRWFSLRKSGGNGNKKKQYNKKGRD